MVPSKSKNKALFFCRFIMNISLISTILLIFHLKGLFMRFTFCFSLSLIFCNLCFCFFLKNFLILWPVTLSNFIKCRRLSKESFYFQQNISNTYRLQIIWTLKCRPGLTQKTYSTCCK